MIALGCLSSAILFVGLFKFASVITAFLLKLLCGGWLARYLLKYFFINSMSCRVLARSMGSNVLD